MQQNQIPFDVAKRQKILTCLEQMSKRAVDAQQLKLRLSAVLALCDMIGTGLQNAFTTKATEVPAIVAHRWKNANIMGRVD